MIDSTNNKSFGFGLTAIHEVRKYIDSILEDIFVFLYRPDLRIEDLTAYENMTC